MRDWTELARLGIGVHPAEYDDSMAVGQPRARVYGVQGLRVVDASRLPFLPPSHPQSTIYAFCKEDCGTRLFGGYSLQMKPYTGRRSLRIPVFVDRFE